METSNQSIFSFFYLVIWKKYERLSVLTDYFTERCRVICRFTGQKYTPIEYYTKYKKKIITDLDLFFLVNKFSQSIVVTGTNGKSTTCKILSHVLKKNKFVNIELKIDLNEFPNVTRWYKEMIDRPAVQKGWQVPQNNQVIPLP